MRVEQVVLVVGLLLAPVVAQADEVVSAPDAGVEVAAAVAVSPAEGVAVAASGWDEVGHPEPGKGQVVFFRPSKVVGALIGFKVREGGVELGRLGNGNYFVLSVEPGRHEYVVHSEAKDILPLEVEAGETYYVQGSLSMGLLSGRPNLSPSSADAFKGARDKLKRSTL